MQTPGEQLRSGKGGVGFFEGSFGFFGGAPRRFTRFVGDLARARSGVFEGLVRGIDRGVVGVFAATEKCG